LLVQQIVFFSFLIEVTAFFFASLRKFLIVHPFFRLIPTSVFSIPPPFKQVQPPPFFAHRKAFPLFVLSLVRNRIPPLFSYFFCERIFPFFPEVGVCFFFSSGGRLFFSAAFNSTPSPLDVLPTRRSPPVLLPTLSFFIYYEQFSFFPSTFSSLPQTLKRIPPPSLIPSDSNFVSPRGKPVSLRGPPLGRLSLPSSL